jgi:alpha-beta hydrolase superfamily lysophospholipase
MPGRPKGRTALAGALRWRENLHLSRLRYYQVKFDPGRARPFRGDWSDHVAIAADGTRIGLTHLAPMPPTVPPPTTLAGIPKVATVLVHGLFAHRRIPSLIELAESLTRFGPVWTMDLRGHGTSGGVCTLGEDEALDVAAVTALVQGQTTLPVVTIGFSMGAAAVVRSAALVVPADAVVSVSGPGPWRAKRGPGAWKTSLTWRVPGARTLTRSLSGVRLNGAMPPGASPLEAIGGIAPAPVLVVHGTRDPFFPPAEGRALYAAAGDPKGLWIIEGGGHAEGLFCDPGRTVRREDVDAFAGSLMGRLGALMLQTPGELMLQTPGELMLQTPGELVPEPAEDAESQSA